MKKQISVFGLFAVLAIVTASSSFAVDQVKLTSGQTVEGKVLADVPNRYVDIELLNGTKKRFERNEVASVERDVPSTKDKEMLGHSSNGFFSFMVGGLDNFNSSTSTSNSANVLFNYGAKVGVYTSEPASFSRIAFALAYNRSTQSIGITDLTYQDLNAQMLFTRVSNSGFYFGPNVGLAFASASTSVLGTSISSSTNNFEAGAQIGYEVFLSDSFSVGPDVRYEHIFADSSTSTSKNNIKFALGFNFAF